MARPRKSEKEKRVSRSVRLAPEVDDWLNHQPESSGKIIDRAIKIMTKQTLEIADSVPALEEAAYYFAAIKQQFGGGLAIYENGKWRRIYEEELKRIAMSTQQKSPSRGFA